MQRHKPYAAAHSTHAQLLHTVGQNSWQVRHECSPFCQRSQHSHTGVSHIEVLFSVGPPPASLSQVSPNSNLPNPHIPAFSNTSPGRAQVTGCHSQICKRGAATHHRQLPDTPSAPPTSHTHRLHVVHASPVPTHRMGPPDPSRVASQQAACSCCVPNGSHTVERDRTNRYTSGQMLRQSWAKRLGAQV